MLAENRNSSPVQAVGFCIDNRHTHAGQMRVTEMFGTNVGAAVGYWHAKISHYAPIMILVAPYAPKAPVRVTHVGLPTANFPRLLRRAIDTLHGARCSWIVEMGVAGKLIVQGIMDEYAEHYRVRLHEIETAGAA